ncbi:MAG: hypothetical protein V3V33_13185 [Candidatus Lokiarchaeia archaeon]
MTTDKFEVLKNPNRERIIREFIDSNEALEFSFIKDLVSDPDGTSRPDYHLDELVKAGLLKRIKKRGFYKLNERNIQKLRIEFQKTVPVCLVGGLGIPTLFTDILAALEEISILPKKYIMITSPDYHEEFRRFEKGKYSEMKTIVHEFDYQSVLRENYNKVYTELEKIIKKEIYEFEIICEVTGGTKPVSIALLNLSNHYSLRRCYFSGRKIIWI